VAENWFLKIDGIDGESTDSAHKGEIDVLAWSWGIAAAPGTGAGSGSGKGAGKATFSDFQFVTRISKASPRLFLSAASGEHHKWAALAGVRASGKSKGGEFLKYKLSDVQVTSVNQNDTDGSAPSEQFSLSYAKIEVTYRPQSPKGKLEPPIMAGWDVRTNKKI
jgi:type VI secretion system secreted protein Hcp